VTIDVGKYYRSYGPMVLRRCRALLGNEDLARDAMHDVFLKLLDNEASLDDSGPSSLLYRMATNISLNKIRDRRRKGEQSDSLLERIAHAEDLQRETQARSLLSKVFARVPETTGAMAVMHLYDGLTLEEVAAEYGLSVSGVRKRLYGLRAELAELEASL
jgi:RNA polymerase sigma factor (sigma-70 family)